MRCCRHCGEGKVNRPRGLCWACYYTPGLREQYPSESRYGSWADEGGYRHEFDGPGAPPEPTWALPGLEKVEVLIRRADRCEELFDRRDAGRDLS